jgi:hypothetical protein
VDDFDNHAPPNISKLADDLNLEFPGLSRGELIDLIEGAIATIGGHPAMT